MASPASNAQSEFGRLRLLFELADAVSRAEEPNEIYRAAVEGLMGAVAADRASVLTFDADGVMRYRAWKGLSDAYRADMSRELVMSAKTNQRPADRQRGTRDAQLVAVPDVTKEPYFSAYHRAFAREGIRALAFIPLLGNGGLIGKFMLYYNAPHEFHTEELQVAQTIAAHVAFATERQQANAALRESEERYKEVFDHTSECVFLLDVTTDGRFKFAGFNRAEENAIGLLSTEVSGRFVEDALGEELAGKVIPNYRRCLEAGTLINYEEGLDLLRGRRYFQVNLIPVRNAAGRFHRIVGVSRDITDRRRTEAALRESEERFRNMADTAPVMIWVSDPDKLITFCNKQALAFTGRTMQQLQREGWMESLHPDDRDRSYGDYCSAFDARRNYRTEYRLRQADGEYRWVLDAGLPRFEPGGVFAGYIGSCIDITHAKRAQEEALVHQKLESMGRMASGIAHDFNNLLGGILASAELALAERADSAPIEEELLRIRSAAVGGGDIVRQLMIYGGEGNPALEPVEVSLLVAEMLELIKISISKHASLITDLNYSLPPVHGNAAQIRQIVMNLMINASEAMGEKRGVIKVSTSRVTGGQDLAPTAVPRLPQGEYLRLEVSDTGCGMAEEARAKVFDPFFTTKFAGRGLGLAVVQGIVRAHGGAINLASTPRQGTTFQILLPCAGEPAKPEHRAPPVASAEPFLRTSGALLLVEDEDALRLSISKMLRKKGISVMEAGDGKAAIDLLRSRMDEIGVILLDTTVPGASSREISEEALRLRPDVRVVLTSAYSRETAMALVDGPHVRGFIRKPFLLGDLLQLLRDTWPA